ncbi:ABC transporter substrate-binding protein [Actinacidiphila epipremni]|uniref:ABC transporter substrate-binding protein n=1 Tax=Actinacidiphila epipremni TaxID=2053013 RepID=A0ABX0ZUA2_9ACTN|nr:ABC transporter substrate-binding protein [Actinacidiphila epipremni]NJP46357.1 ABC transporter substrate-binding protein [Actinacidiphila epipremni]
MRRILAGLSVTAVLLTAAACGSGSGSGSDNTAADKAGGTVTLNVGLVPIVDVAPIYLGKEKGFFDKQGIKLNLSTAQGGAAIVPGVVSGQFQFGFSNVTSLMVAQDKNVPVKGVAEGNNSTGKDGADFGGIAVSKDSPITSAKDLEGKTVAVNTLKNIGDTTVRESVRKAGGDPSKVKFVEMDFAQMPAALTKHQVDAAWVVEPALASVKASGGRVVASNFVDVSPDLTVALYFTSTSYAAQHPAEVKKFQTALSESLAYATAHPDEVRKVVSTYTQIPASLLSQVILPSWPAEPDKASLETLGKLGQQDGLISSAPDLSKLLP